MPGNDEASASGFAPLTWLTVLGDMNFDPDGDCQSPDQKHFGSWPMESTYRKVHLRMLHVDQLFNVLVWGTSITGRLHWWLV